MRRLHLVISFILISFFAQAQDYIVTIKGDTFDCKITKISERFIHFDYEAGNEIRSTVILLDQVQSYNRSVSKSNQTPNSTTQSKTVQVPEDRYTSYNDQYEINKEEYSKNIKESNEATYRFNVFGGYGHLTGKGASGLSQDLKDYEDELRSGSHFGAGFLYFSEPEKAGFGMRLNSYTTSHSGTFSFFDTDLNEQVVFDIEDNINIIYIGPHVASRNKFGLNESALLFGISMGYVSYINNGSAFNQTIRITGEGFGLMADLGIDIELTNGVLLNLEASYLVNSLSKINVNGSTISLPDDSRQNNSHVNIGAGLSFVFQ